MRHKNRKLDKEMNICNASGKAVTILETIYLMFQIGTSTEFLTFLATDRLATSAMLGCDFWDRHLEVIKPCLAMVEMGKGSTIPIVRQHPKFNTNVPVPGEKQWKPFFAQK